MGCEFGSLREQRAKGNRELLEFVRFDSDVIGDASRNTRRRRRDKGGRIPRRRAELRHFIMKLSFHAAELGKVRQRRSMAPSEED